MSCTGCNDGCFDESVQLATGAPGTPGNDGAAGSAGSAGLNGLFGGYSLEWNFETSIAVSPTSKNLRFDNATPASVTKIYINEDASDGIGGVIAASDFLQSFLANGDPGNYGLIKIWKQYDSTKFWLGKVTSTIDFGTYRTVYVTHILSSGTFSAADNLVVSFVSNGANSTITNNSGAIHNYSILDDVNGNKTGTAIKGQLMTTFNIPVNTFESNMDEVTIKGGFSGNSLEWGIGKYYRFNIEIDGQDMIDPLYAIGEPSTFANYYNTSGGSFEIKLYKTASQKLRPVILYKNNYSAQQPSETIAVSETIAANSNILISQLQPNIANVSLPEIICPSVFASNALTVNIYMSSTTGDEVGDGKTPEFRVMNLHASYNKI